MHAFTQPGPPGPQPHLAMLLICSCYVHLLLRQPYWMLSKAASQPSNSLELDIIVIVPTPIERIARTQTPMGDLAAYTRYYCTSHFSVIFIWK